MRCMMKMVRIKEAMWIKLVKKLKECMRANRYLNKQIAENNNRYIDD